MRGGWQVGVGGCGRVWAWLTHPDACSPAAGWCYTSSSAAGRSPPSLSLDPRLEGGTRPDVLHKGITTRGHNTTTTTTSTTTHCGDTTSPPPPQPWPPPPPPPPPSAATALPTRAPPRPAARAPWVYRLPLARRSVLSVRATRTDRFNCTPHESLSPSLSRVCVASCTAPPLAHTIYLRTRTKTNTSSLDYLTQQSFLQCRRSIITLLRTFLPSPQGLRHKHGNAEKEAARKFATIRHNFSVPL